MLTASQTRLQKYKKLVYVSQPDISSSHLTKAGLQQFAKDKTLELEIIESLNERIVNEGEMYFIQKDSDLVSLLKTVEQNGFTLGKEVGIISYGDNPFKELLDITIVEANFEEMGETAAQMILTNKVAKIKNPFRFTQRSSL